MIAHAALTGDTVYTVEESTVKSFDDGEYEEDDFSIINIDYPSANLDNPEKVSQDFFQHMKAFIEQDLNYDMSSWTPESHEIVEEDGTAYDIATYTHDDGTQMTLKVDEYIEEVDIDK